MSHMRRFCIVKLGKKLVMHQLLSVIGGHWANTSCSIVLGDLAHCYLNKEECNLNQSKCDSFVKRVAKNNS